MQPILGWLNRMPTVRRDNLFWLIGLIALLPAFKAGTLSPTQWLDPLTGELVLDSPPRIFGWFALPLGALAIVFANRAQQWFAWLVAATHWITLASPYAPPDIAGKVYAGLALAVLICFVLRGRTNSLAFAGFLVALIDVAQTDEALTWPPILLLVTAIIVGRIVVEAFTQNWSLARQLGRSNVLALSLRTLALWWPMLILIAIGVWLGEQLKSGTENALYAQALITPHCQIDSVGEAATLDCRRVRLRLGEFDDVVLRASAFRQVGNRDVGGAVSQLWRALTPLLGSQPATDTMRGLQTLVREAQFDDFRAQLATVVTQVDSRIAEAKLGDQIGAPIRRDAARLERLSEVVSGSTPPMCVLRSFDWIEVQSEPAGVMFQCPGAIEPATEGDETETQPTEVTHALARVKFFDSAYRTIDRDYDQRRFDLYQRARNIRAATRGNMRRARNEATGMFDLVPEDTGLSTRDCRFLEVKCGASNYVIGELNAAYANKRAEARRGYLEELSSLEQDANRQTEAFVTQAELAMTGRLEQARSVSLAYVRKIETGANVVGQLLQLLLIVAIIKSLLYVFARVIFDKSTDIEVDLIDAEVEPVQGTVRHTSEVSIPADYASDIYFKPNFQPLGPAARFSIPQWTRSWLARIRYGAWHMSQARFPLPEGSGLTFNAIEAEHLVDWEMQPGEEVVFNYNNFVAMNANVELNTLISLRVSNLLLGRMIWHTAKCTDGPGRLILRTRGKPATEAQVRQSIPATRLIAWNRNARFSIDSHLTPQDVFLNGFNLSRSERDDRNDGILVVEADARDGGLLVGTLRFARNFLLPI